MPGNNLQVEIQSARKHITIAYKLWMAVLGFRVRKRLIERKCFKFNFLRSVPSFNRLTDFNQIVPNSIGKCIFCSAKPELETIPAVKLFNANKKSGLKPLQKPILKTRVYIGIYHIPEKMLL